MVSKFQTRSTYPTSLLTIQPTARTQTEPGIRIGGFQITFHGCSRSSLETQSCGQKYPKRRCMTLSAQVCGALACRGRSEPRLSTLSEMLSRQARTRSHGPAEVFMGNIFKREKKIIVVHFVN